MQDALRSDAPLTVYVDVKSPYAYLAVEPTIALGRELGIAIDWRPLTLNIPSYLGSARTDNTGKVVESQRSPAQWNAVRYAYRDAKRYARTRGITLYGTQKIWDSSLAGIGLLWAREHGQAAAEAWLNAVYPPFWRRELDIEDPAAIVATMTGAGVPTAGFMDYLLGAGRQAHDALQERLHPAGIYGVPTYVVAGDLFFGREHLPAVRWLLTGQAGPPPDIRYE
ncbi:MAG: DsbA family protein, partial [Pseudomonadales bacterium]|nr:DsbA family protein [Pseudomonadales bacterium]